MKKMIYVVLAIFLVLVTCSCKKGNNNKVEKTNNDTNVGVRMLVCSGMNEGNNMNAYSNIRYVFRNNKLSRATMNATFKDIEVDNIASVWDSMKAQFTEQNAPVEEAGYRRTVRADDKNYKFTVSINIDFDKITEDIKSKYEVTYNSDMTYDEVLKKTTEDGNITCR